MMGDVDVLSVSGTPQEIGTAHGLAFSHQIVAYTEDRLELSRAGTDLSRLEVMEIADGMLDAHRSYDEDLYVEMISMAQSAGITPAEAVIVGGYTDFIDTVRAIAGGTAMEDTCTAVVTPDSASDGAGFLAQTWDMHASATPHVFMFDLAPVSGPGAMVFTTHGTLGQIGLNESGIAIGINNLTTTDGTIGVTWPFVVRKALRQSSFDDAVACITEANVSGAHNFLVLDRDGHGASIEVTPSVTVVDRLEARPLVHTNHCLSSETRAFEAERPPELQSSSITRLADATNLIESEIPHSPESLMALLRDERSICRRPEPPFDYESSGAVIMRPSTGDMWSCWGNPSENEFHRFAVTAGHR